MKKVLRYCLLVLVVLIALLVLLWHPWVRTPIAKATVEVPAVTAPPAGHEDLLTVIYSGDGGWADLDQRLGSVFATRGIPVVGVSAMKYFWRERPPEEAAHDLDTLLDKYTAQWGKHRVLMIGYSFGADVLPTILAHIRPDNRAKIDQLVLLSASRDSNFEIELEGYMHKNLWTTTTQNFLQWLNPVRHYDAMPPILALGGKPPVACYYGVDDADDSGCTDPTLPKFVTVYKKPGDHHFDYDYEKLATELIERLPAPAPKP
ncbi:type IV secretory pathway VirJ component [Luteibacter sp. Sphag1AF]|uniref:AcvB/VirJ family lysyl-phosphatidylglycerol hydrolase n=1 Tax=Luteibacter sp. Sphag1AF TaxID=2587031 RepID=UPI00161BD7A2|nr:AcvB/VirJ family lysyl-phosphatidylglycerol hydrolase [Luteibacter sp. Sphag1AF]MBB3226732.1 type IV secretory pathway VirJ component [Luteibacter sp. Sphag1AF]